jgi:hypothetical protein
MTSISPCVHQIVQRDLALGWIASYQNFSAMSLDQGRKSVLARDCEAGMGMQTSSENNAQDYGVCAAGETNEKTPVQRA